MLVDALVVGEGELRLPGKGQDGPEIPHSGEGLEAHRLGEGVLLVVGDIQTAGVNHLSGAMEVEGEMTEVGDRRNHQ